MAEQTRFTRVLAYVRANLTDPELTPARIAAAHNLTLQALRELCDDNSIDLAQWITHLRLDGARRDLAAPEHAHRTIDAIARSWGFTTPTHFARRFRNAYGLAPAPGATVRRRRRPRSRSARAVGSRLGSAAWSSALRMGCPQPSSSAPGVRYAPGSREARASAAAQAATPPAATAPNSCFPPRAPPRSAPSAHLRSRRV
ncbi:helix-turn-helix domain-containing protein [Nonomuraea thailandensis]